jgi:hypothetical protein
MTRRAPTSFVLMTVVAVLGCAVSEPIDLPSSSGSGGSATGSGPSGTGGTTATGGALGTGGATATGGTTATGGKLGTGGTSATGGKVGTGGTTATGGASATGGKLGTGGTSATGGKLGTGGTSGTGGTTSTDGGTVTFTEVYTQVIANNCFGSSCHNPGGGDRPSFSSQANCYNYFERQGQLYPGQAPSMSYIYFVMSGDPTASPPSPPYMPPTPNPNVSAADLALVAAWIAGGALNN